MTTQRNRDWLKAIGFGLLLAAGAIGMLVVTYNAMAQTPRTATISFTAPTTRTDGSSIAGALSYELWQGLKGASKTKVGTISGTSTTINTGLLGGREYCWHVVAIEAANPTPSAASADGCKVFDQSGPNIVTITVV